VGEEELCEMVCFGGGDISLQHRAEFCLRRKGSEERLGERASRGERLVPKP